MIRKQVVERSRATMTKRVPIVAIVILFSISSVHFVNPLLQDGFGSLLGSFVAAKQVKIPELLYQLCNNTQGTNATRRDACYGCFYRASILPQGYPMLIAMSTCANTYLNNTNYGHCQAYLRNVTTMPNSQVTPTIIYCTFLECVRQVRKDTLNVDLRSAARPFLAPRIQPEPSIFWKGTKLRVQNNYVCVIATRGKRSLLDPENF